MNALAAALDVDETAVGNQTLEPTATEADRRDIRASLDGDEAAYARLVARHEARVFAQMWRFTRDPRVLDELVQDVFVEVYFSLDKFRGDAPFPHWLARIATRVGYRHWKHQTRDRERRNILANRETERWTPPAGASDASGQLFRLLETLPAKDRLILTLFYYEECSSNEIAQRMGWSSTLVRVRMHRALRKLRGIVENETAGRTDHE